MAHNIYKIVFHVIATSRLRVIPGVGRGAHRIAHVVQGIEQAAVIAGFWAGA